MTVPGKEHILREIRRTSAETGGTRRKASLALRALSILAGVGTVGFLGGCSARTPRPAITYDAQVQPEDCGTLQFGVDGSPGPTTCPDGHANLQAVLYFRAHDRLTIDLDPHATEQQVVASLCHDFTDAGIAQSLYDTAQALNGWKFTLNPMDSVNYPGTACVNSDATK